MIEKSAEVQAQSLYSSTFLICFSLDLLFNIGSFVFSANDLMKSLDAVILMLMCSSLTTFNSLKKE